MLLSSTLKTSFPEIQILNVLVILRPKFFTNMALGSVLFKVIINANTHQNVGSRDHYIVLTKIREPDQELLIGIHGSWVVGDTNRWPEDPGSMRLSCSRRYGFNLDL